MTLDPNGQSKDVDVDYLLDRLRQLEDEIKSLREALVNRDPSSARADGTGTGNPKKVRATPRGNALTQLRRWLQTDQNTVRIHELLLRETKRSVAQHQRPEMVAFSSAFSNEELGRRVDLYRDSTNTLAAMFLEGSYWGQPSRDRIWAQSLQTIANAVEGGNGLVVWLSLRRLPALMLFYAGGIGSIMSGRYETLRTLMYDPSIRDVGRSGPTIATVFPAAVMEIDVGHRLHGLERRLTPTSDWLFDVLQPMSERVSPTNEVYEEAFDTFEYLLGVAYSLTVDSSWAPIGRFAWKDRHRPVERLADRLFREFQDQGHDWPPFRSGLLGADLTAAQAASERYIGWVKRTSAGWM